MPASAATCSTAPTERTPSSGESTSSGSSASSWAARARISRTLGLESFCVPVDAVAKAAANSAGVGYRSRGRTASALTRTC